MAEKLIIWQKSFPAEVANKNLVPYLRDSFCIR